MKGSIVSSILTGLVLLLGTPGMVQGRDLTPDRMETPPIPITGPSVLDDISTRMTSGLKSERDASPTTLAGNQLRRIVVELAARGRGDDPTAAISALEAIRLSEAIDGLTRRLSRLDRDGELVGDPPRPLNDEERSRALKRLETFQRFALDELRRRPRATVKDLDDTMALVLAPIRDAVETVELLTLQDHWPSWSTVMRHDGATSENADVDAGWSTDDSPNPQMIAAMIVEIESLGTVPRARIERLSDILRRIDRISDPDIRSSLHRHQAAIVGIVTRTAPFMFDGIDPQLRANGRKVEKRHAVDIMAVIEDLDRLTIEPQSPDDSTKDRLRIARTSGEDLQRLWRTGEVVDRLSRIQPREARRILIVIRQLARRIANLRTRSDAARDFDRIADGLDRHETIPIEVLLVDPDDRMEGLVAGRSEDLLARIRITRGIWVEEIAAGLTEGPGHRSLHDLERLCRMMVDAKSAMVEDSRIVTGLNTLNRWGGWYVSNTTIGWAARTVTPGLRLAAVAAADGDFERLASDLERLEQQAPPARLVAWFSSNLESSLANLEGGSPGALAAVSIPPSEDAWGLEHRVSMARICRGFAELSAARGRGDGNGVEQISHWLTKACADLLEDISSRRRKPSAESTHKKETDA